MPIDAIWIVITIPKKIFEKTLISFISKISLEEETDKFHDDYYLDKGKQKPYMENTLKEALEYLNINDSVWMSSQNNHYYQVYFTSDLDNNDSTLHYLKSKGIGSKRNSTIGYIPFGLFYYNEKHDPDDPLNYNENYFNKVKDSFLKSVTSRLTVAQVVDGVRNSAEITFDYYMYLLFSCIIAAMGIMNCSPIDVAASMCIEPIMGAVMAVSFGLALLNRSLIWTGCKSLFVGLSFCFLFGYFYGLVFQIWRGQWQDVWPTSEMQSRGELKTLIYGSFIATAGGAVLAIILLKNNIVALTGVAIATTFMPPFVNGGLCLALATHLQIAGHLEDYQQFNFSGTVINLKKQWVPDAKYSVQYSYDMRVELLMLASVSIAYTFINVFCLLAASFILLKIKEIAPLRSMLPGDKKFFSEDIKIYRDHMRKHPESTNIGQDILSEWADLSGINKTDLMADNPISKATQLQTLRDIFKDVESDANYQTITRHAFGSRFQPPLRRRLTEPSISVEQAGNTNLGIFTLSPSPDPVMEVKSNSALSYATIRQRNRNPVPFNVSSPYSLWPSNEPTVIRSRNASIAQMASKRSSLNIN